MAALTDFISKPTCLPINAPKVQAQVLITGCALFEQIRTLIATEKSVRFSVEEESAERLRVRIELLSDVPQSIRRRCPMITITIEGQSPTNDLSVIIDSKSSSNYNSSMMLVIASSEISSCLFCRFQQLNPAIIRQLFRLQFHQRQISTHMTYFNTFFDPFICLDEFMRTVAGKVIVIVTVTEASIKPLLLSELVNKTDVGAEKFQNSKKKQGTDQHEHQKVTHYSNAAQLSNEIPQFDIPNDRQCSRRVNNDHGHVHGHGHGRDLKLITACRFAPIENMATAMTAATSTDQYQGVPKNTVTTTNPSIPVYLSKSNFLDFDSLVLLSKRTRHLISQGLCPTIRLLGGGESSMSNNSSAWNAPNSSNSANSGANPRWDNSTNTTPSTNANNTNTNNSNRNGPSNASMPMTSSSENNNNKSNASASTNTNAAQNSCSWAQQSQSLQHQQPQPQPQQQQQQQLIKPPQSTSENNSGAANANANTNTTTTHQNSLKAQQYHELNVMREALYSFDGWGATVNQDTPWELPQSPEPVHLKSEPNSGPASAIQQQQSSWKMTVNNGTEIWESNLRNGGQAIQPQPVQKAPWGHTPTKNVGGTWGVDDDATDSTTNMWNNVPNNTPAWAGAPNPNIAGGGAGGGGGANSICGPGVNSGSGGGSNVTVNNSNNAMWNGVKKENDWGAPPNAWNSNDPRSLANCGSDMSSRSSMANNLVDPRLVDQRSLIDNRDLLVRNSTNIVPGHSTADLRSRLTNSSDSTSVWNQSHLHPPNKMPLNTNNNSNNNLSQWGLMPKEMPSKGSNNWEEPSPPTQRRNMSNYDDGTSLWGNPNGQQSAANMAAAVAQNRMKQESSSWNQQIPRNAAGAGGNAWDENHQTSAGWDDSTTSTATGSGPSHPWNKSKSSMPAQLWENDLDWQNKHVAPPNKLVLTKEMIYSSKQYRLLVDMGFKREEVEGTLRRFDMNMEDALDALGPIRSNNLEAWRSGNGAGSQSGAVAAAGAGGGGSGGRHDDQFDSSNQFQNRFVQYSSTANNSSSMLNSLNNSNMSSNSNANNISQSLLSSGNTTPNRNMYPMMVNSPTNQNNVKNIVSQIQAAIQSGYLNQHLLNQPFGSQQLIYLNQLLNLVKHLQFVTQQYNNMVQNQSGGKTSANANTLNQYSLQITKIKQQISNLQNHITNQQSSNVYNNKPMYPSEFGKSNDSINSMQSTFNDMSMSKEPIMSRLNQWKLPSMEKDFDMDFSRAPGPSKLMPSSNISSNLNHLGFSQNDGPWGNTRNSDLTGWPDAGNPLESAHMNELKDSQWNQAAQPSISDLVPEFEPGKPWKGNQMKSVEEDPTLTPGSALSSLVTLKDNDIYSNTLSVPKSSSPTNSIVDNLGSAAWGFNPASSTQGNFSSPINKLASTKSTWNNNELWSGNGGGGSGPGSKPRGPPPGLVKTSLVNGWNNGSAARSNNSWASQTNLNNWSASGAVAASSWLMLRNLTAQIDGSTLRTLCMQHGPLQSFHLFLPQSIALVKYYTREEASKALTALNHCVLGNTTIFAESPTDMEVNALLSQLGPNQSNNWRNSTNNTNKGPSGAVATSASVTSSVTGLDKWGGSAATQNVWPQSNSNTSVSGVVGGNGGSGVAVGTNLWNTNALDSSGDAPRATPSGINNFLPGDLLGGESM